MYFVSQREKHNTELSLTHWLLDRRQLHGDLWWKMTENIQIASRRPKEGSSLCFDSETLQIVNIQVTEESDQFTDLVPNAYSTENLETFICLPFSSLKRKYTCKHHSLLTQFLADSFALFFHPKSAECIMFNYIGGDVCGASINVWSWHTLALARLKTGKLPLSQNQTSQMFRIFTFS